MLRFINSLSLVIALYLPTMANTQENLNTMSFESHYSSFLSQINNNIQIEVDQNDIQQISKFHIVLIAGFLNEIGRSDYFKGLQDNFQNLGIQVTRLYPTSLSSSDGNSRWLSRKLNAAFEQGRQKPLIIIGHSKGGQESIITHLDHPELIISNKVYNVITLQSPLSGNDLFANIPFASLLTKYSLFPLIRSLNPDNLEKLIAKRLQKLKLKSPDIFELISSKVFYITSNKEVSQMNSKIKLFGETIAGDENTPNDGLVATKHMSIKNFGSLLGELQNADHLDFVSPDDVQHKERQLALTFALVKTLVKALK